MDRPKHLDPLPASPSSPSWDDQAAELLARAAGLCAEHNVDLDAFMRQAWSAYTAARPGLRDHLEEVAWRAQLDQLRKAGRIGLA